jgi:hypothetical protein
MGNHLLIAHPQFSVEMDNALVISNFPLLTEGRPSRALLGDSKLGNRFRRQFSSDFQEGVFRAARELMDEPKLPKRVWIAAVGNGSLWPIASLPAGGADPKLPELEFEPLSARGLLQLVSVVLILLFLGWWLWRNADPATEESGGWRPLQLGIGVLAAFGSIVLLAALIPSWPRLDFGPWTAAGLVPLLVGTVWIAALPAGASRPAAGVAARLPRRLWLLGLPLLLPVVLWALEQLWIPGGRELFALRVRKLSSGLSPLVSLGCLGMAVYCWSLFDLLRRRAVHQHPAWPVNGSPDPFVVACGNCAACLKEKMIRSLPCRKSRYWILLLAIVVVPAVFLAGMMQPIAETQAYGMVFLVLVACGMGLSLAAFVHFLTTWLLLEKRILKNLELSSLQKGFKRTAPQIGWLPMRSFDWRLERPAFLRVSYEKLRMVARHRPLFPFPLAGVQKEIEDLLGAQGSSNRETLKNETKARQKLNESLQALSEDLAQEKKSSDAVDFLAARVASYLFSVTLHMRYCLLAALSSGFFVLFAVRTYAFEPKFIVSAGIWGILLVMIAVTIWVLIQIDRNPTLSVIGATTPGKVDFNLHFFSNLLTYGLIPLLGIIISQFPEIGGYAASWFNPILKVVGAD